MRPVEPVDRPAGIRVERDLREVETFRLEPVDVGREHDVRLAHATGRLHVRRQAARERLSRQTGSRGQSRQLEGEIDCKFLLAGELQATLAGEVDRRPLEGELRDLHGPAGL